MKFLVVLVLLTVGVTNVHAVMRVSSSDDLVITGTASMDAPPQTINVKVGSLATNEVWHAHFSGIDNSVTSTDAALHINVRGAEYSMVLLSGTTLSQLAAQINAAKMNIRAVVYDTGAGGSKTARLSIVDRLVGRYDADQFSPATNLSFRSTLTNLANGDFYNVIRGVDSKIFLDHNETDPIYRDSNVVVDIVEGVALNLRSTSASYVSLWVYDDGLDEQPLACR